ncbi:hypothetical protein AN958_01557 [Leucoagaricus sp. SymC.cos]|nr:hypothetical protein AN958_01557 [Leucoagaricus sp. SymC.cos]
MTSTVVDNEPRDKDTTSGVRGSEPGPDLFIPTSAPETTRTKREGPAQQSTHLQAQGPQVTNKPESIIIMSTSNSPDQGVDHRVPPGKVSLERRKPPDVEISSIGSILTSVWSPNPSLSTIREASESGDDSSESSGLKNKEEGNAYSFSLFQPGIQSPENPNVWYTTPAFYPIHDAYTFPSCTDSHSEASGDPNNASPESGTGRDRIRQVRFHLPKNDHHELDLLPSPSRIAMPKFPDPFFPSTD